VSSGTWSSSRSMGCSVARTSRPNQPQQAAQVEERAGHPDHQGQGAGAVAVRGDRSELEKSGTVQMMLYMSCSSPRPARATRAKLIELMMAPELVIVSS
jgi:hypothetical protein